MFVIVFYVKLFYVSQIQSKYPTHIIATHDIIYAKYIVALYIHIDIRIQSKYTKALQTEN